MNQHDRQNRPMDKYDKAIQYLEANPGEIFRAWIDPSRNVGGCLFATIGASGGCLTQIRACRVNEWHPGAKVSARHPVGDHVLPELTAEIEADTRIPTLVKNISVESLPVFAEWQRRIDTEYRGFS